MYILIFQASIVWAWSCSYMSFHSAVFCRFCWFCSKNPFASCFPFGLCLFFLFLPQTKFAKLGVSTTRTVSAKAHKKGTIPINLTLPDPLLERVPKFCYCSAFFAMLMHVAAYDTFTPPLSVVDPPWPQWSEGVLGELYWTQCPWRRRWLKFRGEFSRSSDWINAWSVGFDLCQDSPIIDLWRLAEHKK